MTWQSITLAPPGQVVAVATGAEQLKQTVVTLFGRYFEKSMDRPKHERLTIHSTLGYLHTCPAPAEEQQMLDALAALDTRHQVASIDQLWLVHYANRTLNHIVGRVPCRLGNLLSGGQNVFWMN